VSTGRVWLGQARRPANNIDQCRVGPIEKPLPGSLITSDTAIEAALEPVKLLERIS
jgi:hypothetical protein